jgi:hypothetical protein
MTGRGSYRRWGLPGVVAPTEENDEANQLHNENNDDENQQISVGYIIILATGPGS